MTSPFAKCFAILAAVFVLAACAAKNVDKDYMLSQASRSGVVVATITSSVQRGDYKVYYRLIGHRDESGFIELKSDDPSHNGALLVRELLAGDYEFYSWSAADGLWNARPKAIFHVPFHIAARKVVYVGSFHFDMANGVNVSCLDKSGRDLKLVRERGYSHIVDIQIAAAPFENLGQGYSAEHLAPSDVIYNFAVLP